MRKKKRARPKSHSRTSKGAAAKKAKLALAKAAVVRRAKRTKKTSEAHNDGRLREWAPERAGGAVPILDVEGLAEQESDLPRVKADWESVDELAEEGQAMEAGLLSGVKQAEEANADESEVITREVPEDDVPPEYRDSD